MASQTNSSELNRLGKKLVERFSDSTVVRIFSRPTNTMPMREVWSSEPGEAVLGHDGERILGNCEKRLRSVLVHDATKDTALRGVAKHHFKSCLCVPVIDDSKYLAGLIYLTSDSVGAFTTQDRFGVEHMARSAASGLSSIQRVSEVKPTEGETSYEFLYSPATLFGSLAFVLLLLFWAIGPFDTGVATAPNSSVSREMGFGPKQVAAEFAQHLRVGEFAQAWGLLDPELQERWPQSEFQSRLKEWSGSERNQKILLERKLAGLRFGESQAVAIFYGSSAEGDSGEWSWTLRELDGDWRIVGIGGGPIESPSFRP